MSSITTVDQRYRLHIPSKIRKVANLKPGDKLLLKVREDGALEAIPLQKLLQEVQATAKQKLSNWREENHEASKYLQQLVKKQ